MSYDAENWPQVGGSDAVDYWGLGWDDPALKVEGGISTFDGVIKPERVKSESGESPVLSPEQAKEYGRRVLLLEEAQQIPDDSDDLLATT